MRHVIGPLHPLAVLKRCTSVPRTTAYAIPLPAALGVSMQDWTVHVLQVIDALLDFNIAMIGWVQTAGGRKVVSQAGRLAFVCLKSV